MVAASPVGSEAGDSPYQYPVKRPRPSSTSGSAVPSVSTTSKTFTYCFSNNRRLWLTTW